VISHEQLRVLRLNFQGMLKRMLKRHRRATSPPHIPFLAALPPQISDEHFGIAILFKIVGKSNNYTFWDDLGPTPDSRWGICCKSYVAHYLHTWLAIGKGRHVRS